jgi:hypothetical protein
MRTGNKAFLVVVRSDTKHFNEPLVCQTSERVDELLSLGLKVTTKDFTKRLEGYMISGVQGEPESMASVSNA